MRFVRRRQRRAHVRGTVSSHSDAVALVAKPGDLAIVERDVPRSLVMCCPDNCGETITINLDPRTDKAWRIYSSSKGITLFPSVWRDTGCRSHFILWNNVLHWMDGFDRYEHDAFNEARLDDRVWKALKAEELTSFVEIADALGEIPWSVLDACRRLVKAKRAISGRGPMKDTFKKA